MIFTEKLTNRDSYIDALVEKYGIDILKETINIAYFYEKKVNEIDFKPILKKYGFIKEDSKATIRTSYYEGYSRDRIDFNIKNGRNQYIFGFSFKRDRVPEVLQYLNKVEQEGGI